MNKQTLFLISFTVLLGAAYVYFFTDWFRAEKIQIKIRSNPESFIFDPPIALTTIKVYKSAELATNKYAHPIWNMVATNKATEVQAFAYGSAIRGMKPAVANTKPEPLAPNETYKLVVESEKAKGEKEFQHQVANR